MTKRWLRLSVTGGIIGAALWVGWSAARVRRNLQAETARLDQERLRLEAQLREIELGTSAKGTVTAKKLRSTASGQPPSNDDESRGNWMRLQQLAMNDPRMQALRWKADRARLFSDYASFFHHHQMGPQERDALLDVLAEHVARRRDLDATAAARALDPGDPSIAAVNADEDARFQAALAGVLGNEGAADLTAYDQSNPAQKTVDRLTSVLADSAAAITPDQRDALVDLIQSCRVPSPTNPQRLVVDWTAAETQAAAMLAPAQQAEFESAASLERRYQTLGQISDVYHTWMTKEGGH